MIIIIGGNKIGVNDDLFKDKKAAFVKNISKSKSLSHLDLDPELIKEKLSEAYDMVNHSKVD